MAEKVYPVAIVGAGIHGTAIAIHLLENSVPRGFIALIDENACCQEWERATSNMGMTHMRSPWEHYLAGHGQKLRGLAHVQGISEAELDRTPPLELFNQYSGELIRRHGIEELRTPARITKITPPEKGVYTLELNTTSWTGRHQKIRARNIVVATGQGKPCMPNILGVEPPRIIHSHHVNIYDEKWVKPQKLLIVGGGLTAATLAVRLAERGHGVHVAMREPMKIYPFDFPREWFEWSLYWKFREIDDPYDRVEMLQRETYGGSITPEYESKMYDLFPELEILPEITISEFARAPSGGIIPVWDDSYLERYDRVILATGYDPSMFHLEFLRPLFPDIDRIDGLPTMSNTLEAKHGLFFSGARARLGLGAAAANVYGADLAGRIILDALIAKKAFDPTPNE